MTRRARLGLHGDTVCADEVRLGVRRRLRQRANRAVAQRRRTR